MPAIATLNEVTEYPLCWPDTKPRTAARQVYCPFSTSLATAQREIDDEMKRWRARAYVLSMAPQYRGGLVDPAVALWWDHPVAADGGRAWDLRVLACDTYCDRRHNLHAIALTLERLRSLQRYGTYSLDQAIEGARLALPPPPSSPAGPPWWQILGVERSWPLPAIEAIWRSLAEKAHPDRDGGSAERMAALNTAIAAARAEKR